MVQLTGNPGGREVYAIASAELSVDEDSSPEEQDRAAASALQKLARDHRFKGRQVITCFGERELFVQNVRLPELPQEEIEKVLRFEAEERLPYPASEAEIRFLPAGQVRQDDGVKQEVILLACHRDVVERHIAVLEQAGLLPVAIDVEPCAVLRSLRHPGNGSLPNGRRAYLNFGERATMVMFADGDQVLFLKYVPTGGHHLDVSVSEHLDLGLAEAARLRSSVTASDELDSADEIHCSVIDAIRSPLEAMAAEIELCLRYYKVTFRGKPLEEILVTGTEASRWLAEFLEDRLGTACSTPDPFGQLTRAPRSTLARKRPWYWATALGLSLRTPATGPSRKTDAAALAKVST
jgi:type IV pilus assembly protein PilM